MKTSILFLVFVCAFPVSVAGTPLIEQTNSHKITLTFIDFASRYSIGNKSVISSKILQSNESCILESIEDKGYDEENLKSNFKITQLNQEGDRIKERQAYRWDLGSSSSYFVYLDAPGFLQMRHFTLLN